MQSMKVTDVLQYLMLTFIVIPVLIIGIVGTISIMGFGTSSTAQFANSSGLAQSETINQRFGIYENDVAYISRHNAAAEFLSGSGAENSDEYKAAKALLDNAVTSSGVLNAVLIRPDGSIAAESASVQSNKELFYAFDDNVKNMSKDSVLYTPVISAGDKYNEDSFSVVKCVQNDKGEVVGYVAEVVPVKALTDLLANLTFGDGAGTMVVTDGVGTILNFGAPVQKLDGIADQSFKDILTVSGTSGATDNAIANYTANDYNAGGYVGRYDFINTSTGSGWKWVSVYAQGGPFSTTIMIPVGIAIIAMIVVALVCFLISTKVRHSIVSPIKEMVGILNEINEGNHEVRFDIKTKNDFKGMSELFNGLLDDVYMSEELHRTISDISDNMLFEWDFHKETMFLSENFKEKFDIVPSQAALSPGKFIDKLMSEEDADAYKRDLSTLLKNKSGHSAEYQLLTKQGTVTWFSVRTMCITDRVGEPLRIIGVVTDIDNEKKLELQLSERASYDFLSQLYNRSTFERELQSEIERRAQTRVAVVFIDVDDFKFINDRFGHSVGDEVIKYVSNSIKQRVKGTGFAGRFGGDEFVLCVTDKEQIEDIENLSLDLIDELYSGYHSELANVFINVKASIGIAFSPEHGETGASLIAAADEAMYFVKKNGKANYHIYQPEDSEMEGLQHTL